MLFEYEDRNLLGKDYQRLPANPRSQKRHMEQIFHYSPQKEAILPIP